MDQKQVPINRQTWSRFVRAVRNFNASPVGGTGRLLFAALIVLLLAISGLNVANSYVGRDFMTAIEQRHMSGFVNYALLYVAVFGLSTAVAVVYRYSEERLALLWRGWLTDTLIASYLQSPVYYRLSDELEANGDVSNPDQRIADDVRAFTATTISFVLLLLNGTLTVIAFSGVLWSISPLLFAVAVGYAALGSIVAVVLGRPLVWLNYNQSDQEANLRSGLIHVRENAEALVLLRYEPQIVSRLRRQLDALVANYRRIIDVNRNLGMFTTGYNYLIQIIPALVVAPLFIRGDMPFGIITQSAMAFSQLLGAFSLIVTQFQSISSFTAVIARLGALAEGIERAQESSARASKPCEHGLQWVECPICLARAGVAHAAPSIVLREAPGVVAYEELTLTLPPASRVGLQALSATIRHGTRTMVVGDDEPTKQALLWATAGIWTSGSGRILRPGDDNLMFLPERPYLPASTLREALSARGNGPHPSGDDIAAALGALGVPFVAERAGDLDTQRDWDTLLSLGEQQLVCAARLLLAAPQFAFLHRIGTTLSVEQVDRLLRLLAERGITYVDFCQTRRDVERYDAVLDIAADGSWTWNG